MVKFMYIGAKIMCMSMKFMYIRMIFMYTNLERVRVSFLVYFGLREDGGEVSGGGGRIERNKQWRGKEGSR